MSEGEDVTIHFTAEEIALLEEFAEQASPPSRRMTRAEAANSLVQFALAIVDRTARNDGWPTRRKPS